MSFVAEVLGVLARAAGLMLAQWLVDHGLVQVGQQQHFSDGLTKLISAGGMVFVILAWSILGKAYRIVRERLAASMDADTTPAELDDECKRLRIKPGNAVRIAADRSRPVTPHGGPRRRRRRAHDMRHPG